MGVLTSVQQQTALVLLGDAGSGPVRGALPSPSGVPECGPPGDTFGDKGFAAKDLRIARAALQGRPDRYASAVGVACRDRGLSSLTQIAELLNSQPIA
jgi:hypothetical protein